MLSPSASITGIQSGKFYKNSFSTYFRSDKEMEQLADKLAAAQKKNVAVIMENDPYWADVANRFIQQAQHDSLNIVENYQFNTGDSDFRDEWAKLKAKNPDAILFGSDGDDATYPLLKQRNEIYPNAPLYTAEFIEEYLPKPQYAGLMHGLTYIRPQQFANQSSTFALDYQAKFGSAAPLDASNAYDAMMILADAMIHGGLGGDAIRNYLHQNTFDTVTFGKIGFDQLGGVTETGFEMVSVK
jgi:ABC-type branched-subunit amino acid transport system substrate-binding protein